MPFAHFGTLAADSSNVVELIRDIYNVIFMYCGHIALILSFGHIFKQFRIYVMKIYSTIISMQFRNIHVLRVNKAIVNLLF